MSVYSETKEALPGILGKADKNAPKNIRGASYVTGKGVVLYEAVIDGQDLVLTFGHLPFGEMIEAVCAFLNAEGPEDTGSFDPEILDQRHAIAKDLTYRRISLPDKFDTFDMAKLDWFGGHTPVTVWVR